MIASRDVGSAQALDDIGLELVVGRSPAIRWLDHVVALQLAGIGRIGARHVRAAVGHAGVAHDAIAWRVVRDALLLGHEIVVGHASRRLVDEVAPVLRGQREAVIALFHARG